MNDRTAAGPSSRHKNTPVLLGFIAAACLVYCLLIFMFLQKYLAPDAAELSVGLQAASFTVLPTLLAAGLFHIYLLTGLLRRLTGRFLNSLFVLLVIGSGILLCADVTLLSDIGKEYRLLDVSDQWAMLYAFTAFHLGVVLAGAVILQRIKAVPSGGMEAVYLTVHHIALASGILGIAGVFFAMSGAVVPLRFSAGFMAALSAMALIPLILMLVYWRLRAKTKDKIKMDEKQVSDAAFAGLAALIAALPVYILACALDILAAVGLPVSFFIFLLFFIQLAVFSAVVLQKNK